MLQKQHLQNRILHRHGFDREGLGAHPEGRQFLIFCDRLLGYRLERPAFRFFSKRVLFLRI